MKGTKIGVLFLVSIMALAGLGVSYAAWTDYDDIDVSVTTGTFDFQINAISVVDADSATITTGWDSTTGWWVTVSNTYPGWKGYINVEHKNFGSVPLKFYSFQVVSLSGAWDLKNAYTLSFYPPANPTPNIFGTLQQFTTIQYYEGTWGVPAAAITLPAGGTQTSLVSLELGDITDNYNSPVTFIFRQTAIQA